MSLFEFDSNVIAQKIGIGELSATMNRQEKSQPWQAWNKRWSLPKEKTGQTTIGEVTKILGNKSSKASIQRKITNKYRLNNGYQRSLSRKLLEENRRWDVIEWMLTWRHFNTHLNPRE